MTERRRFLVRYIGLIAVGSLVWESAHMPLYAVWEKGSLGEIIYDGLHCTLGDVLIATAALFAATTFAGGSSWPRERRFHVAIAAIAAGLAYTVFSEWLNTHIRHSWTYSDLMPTVPSTGIGLSPVLQWIVVPTVAFVLAGHSLGSSLRASARG